MASTLQNFGVPLGGGKGPMLSPKLKYKFRVRLIGFGPIATPLDVSAQVESVGPALASVADHGDTLAADDRKIAVAVMEDGQRRA